MANTISEAREYELFGYPHTTVQDCDFLQDAFSGVRPEVHEILDIACGTGRHALEMSRRGYRVTGVDISGDMLALARKKAADHALAVTFVQQDMTALAFYQAFDAAFILFNSLTLLTGNDDLIRCMQGVHTALRNHGLFVLQVGNLWSIMGDGQLSNCTFEAEEENQGIKRRRTMETIIGPYNNIMCRHDHRQFWRDGVERGSKSETVHTRIFSLNELDLLCRLTRFRILDVYGDTYIRTKINHPDTAAKVTDAYRSYVLVLSKIDSSDGSR
jgi:SAM-dependent methyltransferase